MPASFPPFPIRVANVGDIPALADLIAISARELGRADYSAEQIEAALKGAWGVDTQLIRDGTYFVIEHERTMVACGGWSKRKTLFGSDAHQGREPDLLDPLNDCARIRAFFVHPNSARRGLGRALLGHCEAEAKRQGFSRAELVATLPGVKLYRECGYNELARQTYQLEAGVSIDFVTMRKSAL